MNSDLNPYLQTGNRVYLYDDLTLVTKLQSSNDRTSLVGKRQFVSP